MNELTQIVILIGKSFDAKDDRYFQLEKTVPRSYFDDLTRRRFNGFDFLCELRFVDAFNYIKGLVRCEEVGVSPYPGSTSLVIWAFKALQRRSMEEWATVAVWIVQHHNNPYSPFNFRRTRDHWILAMQDADCPVRVAARATEVEREYGIRKRVTAERHMIRERIAKLRKEGAPESEELRQRMIEEMERNAGWSE